MAASPELSHDLDSTVPDTNDHANMTPVEVQVAVAAARIDAAHKILDQQQGAVDRAEERMIKLHEGLASRFELVMEDLRQLISDQQKSIALQQKNDETRLYHLESKSEGAALLARAAIWIGGLIMPAIIAASVFLYERELRFEPAEIVELREQLADLRRHRERGGEGVNWISPDRRSYEKPRN